MRPILLVLLACMLYAVINVLLQRKLPGNPGIVTGAIAQIVMLSMSWTLMVSVNGTKEIREPDIWKWCLIVGLIYFCADFCYLQSYALGIKAITASTILLTIPAFIAVINFLFYREKMNVWHCAALLCAALMLTCLILAEEANGKEAHKPDAPASEAKKDDGS